MTSEISNENFDHFDEEDPFYPEEERKSKARVGGNRRLDMNFIGYTYKADVEEQRMMLVNVLKDLGNIDDEMSGEGPTNDEQYP